MVGLIDGLIVSSIVCFAVYSKLNIQVAAPTNVAVASPLNQMVIQSMVQPPPNIIPATSQVMV